MRLHYFVYRYGILPLVRVVITWVSNSRSSNPGEGEGRRGVAGDRQPPQTSSLLLNTQKQLLLVSLIFVDS